MVSGRQIFKISLTVEIQSYSTTGKSRLKNKGGTFIPEVRDWIKSGVTAKEASI